MTNYDQSTVAIYQAIRLEHLRASFMSLICGLLLLFALAAATRLPVYWSTADYARLLGVIAFNVLVVTGGVINIRHHLCLQWLEMPQ